MRSELLFIFPNALPAKFLEELERRAEADDLRDWRRSSFEFRRRLCVYGSLSPHALYHVTAIDKRRKLFQKLQFSIENSHSIRSIYFMAGKNEEIAVEFPHEIGRAS